ncbi:MAG: host-nuclease inhibitor Gam family protein [Proteobacteria bacterium]|nr:host-nuclease inhibitor Gam family protein [Pseudomonadota bacterium]
MTRNASRQKVPAVEHYVCQSRDEANDAIAQIGAAQRQRDVIQTAMNDALAEVRAQCEARAKPFADRIADLTRGVHLWCEANRASLTHDNKVKFHTFATGEVKWRLRPPSISVRGADAVIATLRKLGLGRFLREKVEIDKDALLKEADVARQISGISVVQREDFVVIPSATQLEEVQP